MQVAVEGCCHGELDAIYDRIRSYELESGVKVDLLLCCGDFQAIRHEQDLSELCCPQKYRAFGDFRDYLSGAKAAHVLTVFVGGNHEAPDLLRNLYYGGWVAPNIYYLGHSGVLNAGGLRIAGISGIYNHANYTKGYFEAPPYTEETKRSAYHVREFEVKKLALLKEEVDVFLSHDWPAGIEHFGDLAGLLRLKPYFYEDVRTGGLGNPRTRELLERLRPRFWFAAHLHVRYEALFPHPDGRSTYFLALDKVLPRREFLRFMQVLPAESGPAVGAPDPREAQGCPDSPAEPGGGEGPVDPGGSDSTVRLCYDREWCAILVANRGKMPLNAFPSVSPITLNEPTAADFEAVDRCLADSGLEARGADGRALYAVPAPADLHRDPGAQREAFMRLLGLADNNYFSPHLGQKLQVNLVM